MNEKKESFPWVFRWWGICIVIGSTIGLHVAYYVMLHSIIKGAEDQSAFGDSFGALNSLFSGLTIYGVFYAIWLQRQEIQSQRIELQQNAEQTKKQDTQRLFFQLLHSLETVVDNTRVIGTNGGTLIGREAFAHLAGKFDTKLQGPGMQYFHMERVHIVNRYEEFYGEHRDTLGHVFRLLYHIVSFIDASSLDDDEKKTYIRILRAHLSNPEILLLFYNGLSVHGNEKFFPLIVKYDLLQNLDVSTLKEPEHLKFYAQPAARNQVLSNSAR